MQEKIVHTALENLKRNTGIEGTFTVGNRNKLDGEVNLVFLNGKELFAAEVKKEIRNYQLPAIEAAAKRNKNFLLIAENIFPKIKEELRKQKIAYLDAAGNIFLQTAKHHLWIEGHKTQKAKETKPKRVFQPAGLKVIYLLLTDEDMLNKPQRAIAEKAGIALGNINYIFNGLKDLKFLVEKSKKQFQLVNKKELLEKWLMAYEEKLKPALHAGNFRFLKNEDYNQWKKIMLKKNETFWGGESAGAIMTQYLLPEIFTLYTNETRNNLVKNYRLVPAHDGNIRIYKKFWNAGDGYSKNTVNPVLAYADLINTGDRRCIETAKKIYDELLYHQFQ